MENKANIASCREQFDGEGDEDTLSLSNFAMQEDQSNEEKSALQTPRDHQSYSSSPQDFFEFFNEFPSPECSSYSGPDIIFGWKLIIDDHSEEEQEEEEHNEYQKRDYLTVVQSHDYSSLSSPPPTTYENDKLSRHRKSGTTPPKSSSVRLSNSNQRTNANRRSSYHRDQRVNITALTSMSVKSRRRMFMFGPVKFKPEMELSAIKERQGKRLGTIIMPPPPAAADGREVVVAKLGKRWSHWGMVRSLWGRASLTDFLAKSFGFGCSSGNWIKVAN